MKIFLPLITAVIIFISYFSVGLPIRALTGSDYPTPSHHPIPLSFPFYSVDKTYPEVRFYFPFEWYELYFLNCRIMDYRHYMYHNNIYDWLFIRYFLFINIAGAILGYGLSKAKSIWRYFTRRRPATETISNESEK